MKKYDGTYIDGTNQETFNASIDAVLGIFDNIGECLYVECLKCKHHQPETEYYLCEKCGHNTGVAHYENICQPTTKMNPQLQSIIDTPLPAVENADLRKEDRKTGAKNVRALLKRLNLTGISVTTPNYSMAQSIHITLPKALENPNSTEHQKLHDELWRASKPGTDCPHCGQHWNARQHLEAIILAAFPDLNNRSDLQSDYFDYCLSFD